MEKSIIRKPIIILATILGLLVIYLLIEKETYFYIGIANPSENIDLEVSFDGQLLHSDTLKYNPFSYIIIKKKVRGGVHKLTVKSNKADLLSKRNLVFLFKHHIVIEYYPELDYYETESSFLIRNRLKPFYLE
jgi:hypothetical protein